MADAPPPRDPVEVAFETDDPRPLLALSHEELSKLKAAEEILEARFQAKKRANRVATLGASLVGYVALAGFFANAYQNYNNKQHLQEQSSREQAKWDREFARAQAADKYRAFFETSALVTDLSNSDRRLIGYALLEEFIRDTNYHPKAVVILEESLAREMRESEGGPAALPEDRRIAVRQIVRTLSASPGCDELVYAARSIDRVTQRARDGDEEEAYDLFALYARRLVGRAAIVCRDESDFDAVRLPIRDALARIPWAAGLPSNATSAGVNAAVAHLLVETCGQEMDQNAVSDCPEIRERYGQICDQAAQSPKKWAEERTACEVIREWRLPTFEAAR